MKKSIFALETKKIENGLWVKKQYGGFYRNKNLYNRQLLFWES